LVNNRKASKNNKSPAPKHKGASPVRNASKSPQRVLRGGPVPINYQEKVVQQKYQTIKLNQQVKENKFKHSVVSNGGALTGAQTGGPQSIGNFTGLSEAPGQEKVS